MYSSIRIALTFVRASQDHKNRLEAVQRRVARFVCKDSRRTSSVSTMITKLGWKPLENRRAISRLSLLFKSIHHTVAINTDKHLTSQADNKICTRKSCEISFTHPTVKKDCYKHSFLPRTMTEWNLLPPNIRQSTSVDSLNSKLNNMDLTSFIRGGPLLKSTPLAINAPATVYPVCGVCLQYPTDTDREKLNLNGEVSSNHKWSKIQSCCILTALTTSLQGPNPPPYGLWFL